MKYRGSSKIKTKHGIILGLERFLKKIEPWREITALNPGRIKPRKKGSPFAFRIQYRTKSGLKIIARSQGVQEVFIVSSSPGIVEEKLKRYNKT
ncbi:hypothetical protein A3A21_00460 [Candidatus Jorgensenbacteria bacterium RIFCSPLOWO2_01_FULL_45_25b]|uniref:Metal-binding protein n=1 Tax=Candidatus Jorgensenbacteria bacterium RIFCSPLOWO2_01_FULL_45_25b TaxID=1798471 RepID=A0A1F6BRV6_9BACT|nr:MAG: hypothetical protein A3A21_00460 [Candidatus Jorgensenbacteria bacterium RIFCSPLOWO2_01_FULL_45_25b]